MTSMPSGQKKKPLLTGAKAEVDAYLEEWRKAAANHVCEAFELVKAAERERFGEKSYFYRKASGLPSADLDEDPDSAGEEVFAHGFEEAEGIDATEEEMDVDAGEL